jgi:cholesterol transport system auxiliary component
MIRPLIKTAGIALIAVSLSGCVSLLPKAKEAQTYRFGGGSEAASGASQVSTASAFGVLKAPTGFVRAGAGDQLLTVLPGGQTAYIAQARWVSPAQVLFDEALERRFDADPGPARLIARGEAGKAELVLKLDVRTFEAFYPDGADTVPTVRVEVRALITRNLDRSLVSDQLFTAGVPASDNRVSAISAAFDKAVSEVLTQVVAATNAAAPAAATAPAAIAQPTAAAAPAPSPTTPIAPPVETAPAAERVN